MISRSSKRPRVWRGLGGGERESGRGGVASAELSSIASAQLSSVPRAQFFPCLIFRLTRRTSCLVLFSWTPLLGFFCFNTSLSFRRSWRLRINAPMPRLPLTLAPSPSFSSVLYGAWACVRLVRGVWACERQVACWLACAPCSMASSGISSEWPLVSLSHSLSHSLSLTHSPSLTHTHSLTLTHSLSLTHSLTRSLTHSLTLSPSRSLSLSLALSLFLSLSFSRLRTSPLFPPPSLPPSHHPPSISSLSHLLSSPLDIPLSLSSHSSISLPLSSPYPPTPIIRALAHTHSGLCIFSGL